MPAPITPTVTFEELHRRTRADSTLPPDKRASYSSALNRFAEICHKTKAEILADPATIRTLAGKASWQMAGLSKATWANLKSNLTAAMKSQGIAVHRRCRRNYVCAPDWEKRLVSMSERDRRDLRRFAGWCSSHAIAPEAVDREVFERFLAHLQTETIIRKPKERWHVARRVWNRTLAADENTGFPPVLDVGPQPWRGLPWTAFPVSLQEEVAEYGKTLDRRTSVNKIRRQDRQRLLSPVTIRNYRNGLRWHLSKLVEDGVPLERLESLEACLDPDLAERGLALRLEDREIDERSTASLSAAANALLSFARFARLPENVIAELKEMADTVRHRPSGMCERNRERLATLRAPAVQKAFVRLPPDVARRHAEVQVPTCRQAQDMQMAALLEILQHMPLRIENAANLDLDVHIKRPEWRISIPEHEVKNKVALDGVMGEESVALLDLYLTKFRPVLDPCCSALFVSQSGREKGGSSLSKQLHAFIKRELGIEVNAHLLRHWTAFVYLDDNPGDYETVRQFLGHKSITTTVAFYTGAETESAHRRLDTSIAKLRYGELADSL